MLHVFHESEVEPIRVYHLNTSSYSGNYHAMILITKTVSCLRNIKMGIRCSEFMSLVLQRFQKDNAKLNILRSY